MPSRRGTHVGRPGGHGTVLVLAVVGLLLTHCGDGTVQPIRELSTSQGAASNSGGLTSFGGVAGSAGKAPSAGGTGGTNSAAGGASSVDSSCAIVDWPDEWLEDEMLAQLNTLRTSGVGCGFVQQNPVPSLQSSETLRCAARIHSMTAFSSDILETPTPTVELWSDPSNQVNVSSLLGSVVQEGAVECELLLAPNYDVVGIGFSSDGMLGYWTIYLGTLL